ncbi:helix-turn-helix transcriptional regulator [Frankia sp. Cppng1_Ct_nod]|uniref:helix-turn-helix domain-containing protein n=1 Tax=Frankia sp. Cppng1_Ct_nod TaxID=2897162 RepID=UPI0010411407|nr:helix-turn-helix transcriptional regulator [Frankia sp. Cppng1_Ct_nod]
MNQLQQLIRSRIDERGWSYAEVARRGRLPRSTVHNLATNARLLRLPQPATLDGLARGLELPLPVVRSAAAAAAGLTLHAEAGSDPEVTALVAGVEQLSPVDRKHVTALVESLLRHARARDDTGHRPDHPQPDVG